MIKLINFLQRSKTEQIETLNWRNSQNVTKYFQIQDIKLETHLKWLDSLTKPSPRTIAFFIENENKLIGVTYFHSIDYANKICDWGMYIYDTSDRGKGIGSKVLAQSLDYAANDLGIKSVFLEVLPDNERAKKVYEKSGFKLIENKQSFLRYQKDL